MLLYLVRHAHALDAEDDAARPLSARGREQVRTIARFLKSSGAFAPAEIWHSPLARSIETAQLLAKRLDLAAKLAKVDGLEGDADPSLILKRLAGRREPLAIVGHNPHLAALTSLLLAGSAEPPRIVLKKCAIAALEPDDEHHLWAIRWHISPEIVS